MADARVDVRFTTEKPAQPCLPGCTATGDHRDFGCVVEQDVVEQDVVEQDVVNHPPHYTAHPSGVECIQITEHMGFNLGNAVKYIWRADEKGSALQDLEKARWYINRELERRAQL